MGCTRNELGSHKVEKAALSKEMKCNLKKQVTPPGLAYGS